MVKKVKNYRAQIIYKEIIHICCITKSIIVNFKEIKNYRIQDK